MRDHTAMTSDDPRPDAGGPDDEQDEQVAVYEDGFTLRTILGTLFVGLVMMPGSIYMGLMAGQQLGPAAQWVTIILFTEVARRSFVSLKRQEIYILYYVAAAVGGGMVLYNVAGGPFTPFIWNQYLARSPQAQGLGIAEQIPRWAVPAADSPAMTDRLLVHRDWLVPILLIVVGQILGRMKWFGLGYVLFRVTADAERLPFPLAPIWAEGATALAETTRKEDSWRWPVFSTGAMIGALFGVVYVGVPAVTNLVLDEPIMILPIPFLDLTDNAHSVLPASLVGLSFDLGIPLFAMVLPFSVVAGLFTSSMLTSVFGNPIFYRLGMLPSWKPGMDLLSTKFVTDFDLWMSIGIGTALAVAVLGFVQMIRGGALKLRRGLPRPEGRGDFPMWVGLLSFGIATGAYIAICHALVPRFPIWILIVFGFVWTPLNSYISARMIALTGRPVSFPFLREASFILARYRGVDIWFAPIPLHDFGGIAQQFRVLDLTRTKIASLLKAELLIIPISLVCSFMFWAFFWYLEEIPSSSYPFTAKMWPMFARYRCLFMTATTEETPWLLKAIKLRYIGAGFGMGMVLYGVTAWLGLPALFFYGLVGGIGAWPNMAIPQFAGACLGRYVIAKRLGEKKWRRYVPVLAAGYACGIGLVGMFAVGISIISRAVSGLPF